MSVSYTPSAGWIQKCHLQNFMQKNGFKNQNELFEKARTDIEWFWTQALPDIGIEFEKPYRKLLAAGLPFPEWVPEAELSIPHHCIDRHLAHRKDAAALIFEADEEGPSVTWTFEDLHAHSSAVAQMLIDAGAKPGDRAALLMPMSLEMVAAFFGILRAGLSVILIFSGYGAEAIRVRLQDAQVKFAFVQERTTRKGKEIPVRATLESLASECPSLKKILILNRKDFTQKKHAGMSLKSVSKPAESEALLLYTSGTTGTPKACVHTPFGVLATCGKEHRYHFDVHEGDRFFWYTDIGWMMGPWELIGALQFGASVVLYEGVPDFPDSDRLWRILARHKVTHLGISPTAVRVLKKNETGYLKKNEFPDLRILGSTGEPWDEESWNWFFKEVGKSRCPIMNISGGTEIMGCLLGPTPFDSLKPSSLSKPILGVNAQIWSEDAKALSTGLGHLVCLSPLPSMTKGFLGNRQKYLDTYFEKFGPQVWYHGDWALCDEEGFWFLKGRSDDTIKVAGKRVGPNEYESALMEDTRVQESAAVGIPHEIKGESVFCYVVLKNSVSNNSAASLDELKRELEATVVKKMGKALAPDKILIVKALPKTRSGKILRSLIRKVQLSENADFSAVENLDSLDNLRNPL